jgi:peptide/nickel transport system substrate-binding protein
VRGTRRSLRFTALVGVIVLTLVLAACGSSSKKSSGNNTGNSSAGKAGGTVVLGAEQWPSCINPVSQCANSSWLQWLVPIHVLPRLAELDANSAFVASPLITELPSTSNGGVTGSGKTFTVTYHLNPDAKWDDGTPITSADVQFSWQAQLKTTGALTTAGYDKVTAVDMPNPQTAVVHFGETYNDWPDVMGGFSGVVLEKAKFPGGPDTSKTMQQTIGFSGGPWVLTSFSKDKLVLTKNAKYWDADRVPKLDSVTFVPVTDTATEVQAVKTGQVAAVFPQPAVDNVPQLQGNGLQTKFGVTTQFESLWMNNKPGHPLQDKNIRLALAYAFDRQLFLNDIIKPFDPNVTMLNCAMWVPTVGKWCQNNPYQDVTPQPAKVTQYMTASGYQKNSAGLWAKNGKVLTIKWMADTGNKRREDTQAEFIPLLKKQGFTFVTDNVDHDTEFQKRLPAGDYDFAMFINVASPDPTVTSSMSCDQIPSAANKGQGQNDWWYCNKTQADPLMASSDAELNVDKRVTQINDLDTVLRNDMPTLPLYQAPTMVSWQPNQVTGPVDQYINSPESVFWNLWAWTKA